MSTNSDSTPHDFLRQLNAHWNDGIARRKQTWSCASCRRQVPQAQAAAHLFQHQADSQQLVTEIETFLRGE